MITQGEVLDIASQAIYTIIVVSAPLLLVSLIIGLIISIILAVVVGMMIFGSWILTQLTEYITDLWSNFGVFLS